MEPYRTSELECVIDNQHSLSPKSGPKSPFWKRFRICWRGLWLYGSTFDRWNQRAYERARGKLKYAHDRCEDACKCSGCNKHRCRALMGR